MAVKNMTLYACIEGNTIGVPATSAVDWKVCMYTPARAGPTELPKILSKVFIPRDMPVSSDGVASIITFIAPTYVRESPVERTAKFTATVAGATWNATRPKNPTEVIAVPMIIGLTDPNLLTMRPDVGPKIKSTIAKGNWVYPTAAASPPKPSGTGLRTSTGIV